MQATKSMSNINLAIPHNYMLLGNNNYYSLDCHETGLNNNVIVVGTSGSGKTRSIVAPNILQCYGSYILSDPKGSLYKQYSTFFKEQGYNVQVIDFTHPEISTPYNFFNFIRNQQDVLKVAHMITYGANPSGSKPTGGDPFWDQAATLLMESLIAYMMEFYYEEDRNLSNLLNLLDQCEVEEDNGSNKNKLDTIMMDAAIENPNSFAVKQYRRFRIAASRTLKSILITLNAKVSTFDTEQLNIMLNSNEIDFSNVGSEETIIFVVTSDTDRSMDTLSNIFYTQAMSELCRFADNECPDFALPVPVRFIMDDFATNATIHDFPRMISSIRSRNISTMLMIQAEAQLSNAYREDGQTIIANCDTYIYLGTNDIPTMESIAKRSNTPLPSIVSMPVGTNWVFRRGQAPQKGTNFDLSLLDNVVISYNDDGNKNMLEFAV